MGNNLVVIPENIFDVMTIFEKEPNKIDRYRLIVRDFHDEWKKRQDNKYKKNSEHFIWGSKVVFQPNTLLRDVFFDIAQNNILTFFIDRGKSVVSEVNEEDLLNLMYYTMIGFLKFKAVIDILFTNTHMNNEINEYKNSSEIEVEKEDHQLEDKEKIKDNEDLKDNNSMKELLNASKILYYEAINIQEFIKGLEKENRGLHYELDNTSIDVEKLQVEAINYRKLINELETQNRGLLLKLENKEEELEESNFIIEELNIEKEADKKVLDEFENVIKIVGKIKDLISKN